MSSARWLIGRPIGSDVPGQRLVEVVVGVDEPWVDDTPGAVDDSCALGSLEIGADRRHPAVVERQIDIVQRLIASRSEERMNPLDERP